MPRASLPELSELSHQEALAVLERNHVGRVAYTFHDRVDIEPIHYVYDDGWIFGRTSPGAKLTTIAHNPYVAFEVDEVEGLFEWRSVVLHGTVYPLDPEGSPGERRAYPRGVELLRELVPETLRPDDPTPHRSILFRIQVHDVHGRRARMPGGPTGGKAR